MFKYFQRLAIFVLTFLVLSGSSALAQLPTPKLLCLSVQDDGNLLVSWEQEGTTDFRAYYKYANNPMQPVPFDFASAISPGIIPVPDANDNQYEVYLVTYEAGSGIESSHSQILRTIEPKVIANQNKPFGIAEVSWNPLHETFTGTYKVYRSPDKSDITSYRKVAETADTWFTDIIDECGDGDGVDKEPVTLYYYVDYIDDLLNSTCTSRSMTVESATKFKDETRPGAPEFEYITINEDGYAVLHWSLDNPPDDLDGYKIEVKEKIGATEKWQPHAIVGITNSVIDDPDIYTGFYMNPCDTIVNFVIKAFDKCDNSSEGSVAYAANSIHNTIWLQVDLEAECNRKATLTWNRYNNMIPPISHYYIYRSKNGADPEIFREIENDNSELFTYIDKYPPVAVQSYTYHISTKKDRIGNYSESCRVKIHPNPKLLESFDLDNVSVHNSAYIQLFSKGKPSGYIKEVAIYRSANNSNPDVSDFLTRVSWDSGPLIMEIPDPTAEVNETPYYYQLVALDKCGNELERSQVMRSIYLELEDQDDNGVQLNWNAFEGWDVEGYEIFRMTDGIPDPDFSSGILSGTNYLDISINPATTNGIITYYVEAIKKEDEVRDDKTVSRSNEVQLFSEAKVLMPNAFRPESGISLNQFFPHPDLIKNIDPSQYLLVIYNRWGQIVYETKNPKQGWDGTKNGQTSPGGIYGYVLNYVDYNGNTFRQTGTVTLLR